MDNSHNKYDHIKEIEFGDRILGGKSSMPLKIKVCLNGTSEDKFFNVQIKSKDLSILYHILNEIDNAYRRFDRLNYAKFKRIFDKDGNELESLNYSLHQTIIWASTGDNWKDPKLNITYALSIQLNMLAPVPKSLQGPLKDNEQELPNEEGDKNESKDSDSISSASNGLSDENDKELADFFKNNKKKSFNKNGKKKVVPGNPFLDSESTPGNPFETNDDSFDFKTYIERLNPEKLANFCKADDWNVLASTDAEKSINELVASGGCPNFYMDDSQTEINQKKAFEFLMQAKNESSLMLYPQVSSETPSMCLHTNG